MLLVTLFLGLSTLPQTSGPTIPNTAEARRAAVEVLVTPTPWVEGHAFSILERMNELAVPGVSVAVIQAGRLDWAAGYGVRDRATGEPVTPATLFQAGSISKPVAAMAAMAMAQAGELDLDAPINDLLRSWQLPKAAYEGEVTPRRLMSHTAGLSVHGFPGYGSFEALPSVVEILAGAGNTAAVRRIEAAGTTNRYSGGGSTLLQLAMCDVSGMDFAELIARRVLEPLEMRNSTYAQPLPVENWPDHSAGHGQDGHRIPGRFRTHPEQFAAGLWTTASDIARFAIELQGTYAGKEGRVLNPTWGKRMLSPQRQQAALGVFLEEHGGETWFGHGGSNMGFKNVFRASLEGGRGVAILTNGDRGSTLADEIIRAVARVYGWPGVVEAPLPSTHVVGGHVVGGETSTPMSTYAGRYALGPDRMLIVRSFGDALFLEEPPRAPRRMAPLGANRFMLPGSSRQLEFQCTGNEKATSVAFVGGNPIRAPRMDDYERWPIEDLLEGELEEGIAFYREVHEADPDDPLASRERLIEIVTGLWAQDRGDAAVAVAQLIVELFPGDTSAWDKLAEMHASRGDTQAAVQAYEECLSGLDEDPRLADDERNWLRDNATWILRKLHGEG